MDEPTKPADALTFLKHTAANRGPGKRRIKLANVPPVGAGGDEAHAVYEQMFGGADSDDDDEEFDGGAHGDGSDESASDSGTEQGEAGSDEDGGSEGGGGESGAEEKDDSGAPDADEPCASSTNAGTDRTAASSSAPARLVCQLCLNERKFGKEAESEVVQCDKCGVCVHEKCYGYFDPHTVNGSPIAWRQDAGDGGTSPAGSSSSTEPWFCDVCLSLQRATATCELCPATDGVFKRMQGGGWVHLLCALYLQQKGVSFANVFCLNDVSFEDLDYSLFGAKTCSLCADRLEARTGVCIECEAGLCRTFFHVTCAHRHGLLLDQSDVQSHHGFFACCKKHSDPDAVRMRRALYMESARCSSRFGCTMTERELSKLHARHSAYGKLTVTDAPYKKAHKRPRSVYTHAALTSHMVYKCELELGMSREQWADRLFTPAVITYAPPAFAPEFFAYYKEREGNMMAEAQRKLAESQAQLEHMREGDEPLKRRYDEASRSHKSAEEADESATATYTSLAELVRSFGGTVPKYRPRSARPTPTKVAGRRGTVDSSLDSSMSSTSPASKRHRIEEIVEHQCATCTSSADQHLLAHCGTCDRRYHMACLDPPLARLPAASARYQWECSNCFCASSDEHQEAEEDGDGGGADTKPEAPRQLRVKRRPVARPRQSPLMPQHGRAARGGRASSTAVVRRRARPHVDTSTASSFDESPRRERKEGQAEKEPVKLEAEGGGHTPVSPKHERAKQQQHPPVVNGLRALLASPPPVAKGDVQGQAVVNGDAAAASPRSTASVDSGGSGAGAKRRSYERADYPRAAMDSAVAAVLERGRSVKASAAMHNVPRTTVGRRVRLLKANVTLVAADADGVKHEADEDEPLVVDVPRDRRERTPVIRVEDLDLGDD